MGGKTGAGSGGKDVAPPTAAVSVGEGEVNEGRGLWVYRGVRVVMGETGQALV